MAKKKSLFDKPGGARPYILIEGEKVFADKPPKMGESYTPTFSTRRRKKKK